MKVVKVLQKGQIVIPKDMRDKMGLKKGDEVMLEQTPSGSIYIFPSPKDRREAMIALSQILEKHGVKTGESGTALLRKMRREDEERYRKKYKKWLE